MIPPEAVERFRADFAILGSWGRPVAVAVSGGPDSLALLLLAASAFPGEVLAATVDHGMRPESAAEARHVAEICARLRVPHAILAPMWTDLPLSNVQAKARAERYRALRAWARSHGRSWVATAHHVDDQAETLLMRLARGAGLNGLAGVRQGMIVRTPEGIMAALRPLLGWRKAELAQLVSEAGFSAIEDPSNDDDRFDRTRARRLLAATPWLKPERVAASAAHLADCEAALDWAASQVRPTYDDDGTAELDASEIPWEIQRRVLNDIIRFLSGAPELPGPKVARLLAQLNAGSGGTLAGILVRPGPPWRFEPAPPRRTG
jgi:tRNA(Ile)-lysidine synthase